MPLETRHEVTIEAPAARVWAVWTDVARWPEWTASVTSVEPMDPGPLQLGSRARIAQPGLPVAVWQVTAFEPLASGAASWTWVSRTPGSTVSGWHRVTADPSRPDGACVAAMGVVQEGVLGVPIGWLLRGKVRRYLGIEGAGLRARSLG